MSLNLLYQFWLHATWIPRLGWLEGILNTPSSHRVHHAANIEYLDANYGGVLIIFDRLFGTYVKERDDLPCRYGLVHPITSYNPLRVESAQWVDLLRDLAGARMCPRSSDTCSSLPAGRHTAKALRLPNCAREREHLNNRMAQVAPESPHTNTAHCMRHAQPTLNLLWRELRIFIPVSAASTVFFYVMYRDSFVSNLIYSLCSALFIQGLIEVGRYGLAYRIRKRSPDNFDAQRNWPGWGLMIPWIVVSGIVGYAAGHMLGDLLTGVQHAPAMRIDNPRPMLLSMAGVFVFSLGITYFFYARSRMAAMETRTEAALRSAAESQLKLLESQLEPHMLFNTLANLRVLIAQDPPRAQAMLDRLIGFLRATLDASRSGLGSHSLSAEFARIDDYLELMQTRMGNRLSRRLDLPDELGRLSMPPLLLQPLVENAIKHGLEPKVAGGWIRVSAQREGSTLVLSVRDTGAGIGGESLGDLPPGGSRFGIQQVRERLAALYGKTASLELVAASDDEGGTLAIVRLPVS